MRPADASRRVATLAAAACAFTWRSAASSLPSAPPSLPSASSSLPSARLRFPLSWSGEWRAERELAAWEGDSQRAECAWRVLGGEGDFVQGHCESYTVRFVEDSGASTADWRHELRERCLLADDAVVWQEEPRVLRYSRAQITTVLSIGERTIYTTASTFGASEKIWATELGSDAPALLMRMSRSYLPVNDAGNIAARESIKTFGTQTDLENLENPTSVCRSTLLLRPVSRRYYDPVRRQFRDA
jgi:hypothetical protein